MIILFFGLSCIESNKSSGCTRSNPRVAQDQGNKYVHVGLAMTTLTNANFIFSEHNVDLSMKGVEHS
jgi:hypothetical protein